MVIDVFYLDDPPMSGAMNMAVDESLLEQGFPVLRFYRWSEPTVSLGYFQRYETRNAHSASRNASVVRRRSGGGAIVHDRELTYSLVLPNESRRLELYESVHRSIIVALRNWGIESELSGVESGDKDAFLCFQRISSGDVVVRQNGSEVKIVGSAQYRNGFCGVLQHGSILLDRSAASPELDGIRQVSGTAISDDDLVSVLRRQLENDFFWRFRLFDSKTIRKRVDLLWKDRYTDEGWTQKK